ncbi:hypothetical protein [Priestia aryabhattai]|uniref:hypothetical protein n=1 Tax=Priestia aryabhattai TaxID=412384 RepID=UPI001C8E4855|nr:hypothetical protein [Priestia aryabhattai]MBY0213857.1 hypothetical protein [Priestia aryabhattai]
MTINHSGRLSKEYFVSYMKLFMNAYEYTAEQAKELTFQRLFGAQCESLGDITYKNFLLAYDELKNLEK